MALRASLSLFGWGSRHKPQLALVSAAGITRIASGIAYVVLTVVIARYYGEWTSGLMIGLFNLYQAFLTDPMAGGLSDRIGSKTVVMSGAVLLGAAGVMWLALPSNDLFLLTIFALLLFASYSCRDEVYAYLLRTSGKQEGGFVFGVTENIFALMTFLSTLAIPFFIATDRRGAAGLTMLACAVLSLVMALGLPDDRKLISGVVRARLNPLGVIRSGWHFVRTNGYYPLLPLGNSLFEGLFYGTIWFVMPLKIAGAEDGWFSGLTLGVYELVTILGAAYSGYLADRYNWRKISTIGWTMTAVGAVLLLFSTDVLWLVLIGAFLGVGNNLFAFAASHALEANDIDHAEDGSFIGLNNFVSDAGYGIAPIIVGSIYLSHGFSAGMGFAAAVTVVIALVMVVLGRRLGSPARAGKPY